MDGFHGARHRRVAHRMRRAAAILLLACGWSLIAAAETLAADPAPSGSSQISEEMRTKLSKRGDLTLRDATLIDALFTIREIWGVNLVVGNDVQGDVNGSFVNAPLYEILDAILVSKGYGYRPVGDSLVIVRLDEVGGVKPMFKTEIFSVRYVEPNELTSVIEHLLSPNGSVRAVTSSKSLVISDYPDRLQVIGEKIKELDSRAQLIVEGRSSSSLPSNTGSDIAGGDSGIPLPVSTNSGGAEEDQVTLVPGYFHPQFVDADVLRDAVGQLLSAEGKIASIAGENRLVVLDRPEIVKAMIEALENLDVPRRQVRITALIYDASLDDIRRIGFNWRMMGKGTGVDGDGVAQDSILLDTITAVAPPTGTVNGALTFTTLSNNLDLTSVVHAMSSVKDTRLLADPSVAVVDREEALFKIVREIPYQQLTQGLQGGSIGTTAFKEAGISLKVIPRISNDGTIEMAVTPTFSILTGFTTDSQPIIDTREAITVVRVGNCQTLVIGGLRQRSMNAEYEGIPKLKDIRLIGHLFRYKKTTVRDSELLVFLNPQIITPYSRGTPRQEAALGFTQADLDQARWAPQPPPYCGPEMIQPFGAEPQFILPADAEPAVEGEQTVPGEQVITPPPAGQVNRGSIGAPISLPRSQLTGGGIISSGPSGSSAGGILGGFGTSDGGLPGIDGGSLPGIDSLPGGGLPDAGGLPGGGSPIDGGGIPIDSFGVPPVPTGAMLAPPANSPTALRPLIPIDDGNTDGNRPSVVEAPSFQTARGGKQPSQPVANPRTASMPGLRRLPTVAPNGN